MPAKTRTRRSVCEDGDLYGYNIPSIGQSQSASSSRTFLNYDGLNFDGWSPKGCPVLPLHSSGEFWRDYTSEKSESLGKLFEIRGHGL